jgi:phosphatidylserine/phosphatidylglycerophosphate/cardiolipin synthase-like enzyme
MAVVRAEQFIYIEDQYLVGNHLAIAINVALGNPKLKRVIILIPHSSMKPHPNCWRRRKEFVTIMFQGLSKDQTDRVTICYRKAAGAAPDPKFVANNIPEAYIHAKMMIVDDRFASIGSMNCGLRSYTNDSEFVAGIYDECSNPSRGIHFAHDLRIRLWAKHLGMKAAQVFDPIGAAVHWKTPPITSSVGVYDPDADTDSMLDVENALATDLFAEPYGGAPGKELTP